MSSRPASPEQAEHPPWVESVYQRLAEDDDGRVCEAISDAACRETPGNFLRMLVANALSSVADRLASAKSTLPWLLLHLGAPGWMTALMVPIRESGSMLPQLLLGAWVRRRAVRKWIWVAGGGVQAAALALMAAVAVAMDGAAAGWAVLGLVVVFSLARAACSIAYKDVQGKTIPKTRRGRLAGWIGAVAGLASMAVGAALGAFSIGPSQGAGSAGAYALLLAGAAAAWALAAAWFGRIVEQPGATEGGIDGAATAWSQLGLLRDDAALRRFVVARALAVGSGLAAPFVVVLAQASAGDAAGWLGAFIVAEGLASLLSSPLWGRWADRSSRGVFAVATALAGSLSLAVAAWAWWGAGVGRSELVYLAAFLGLGIAHAGVRLGRKTHLVDMAEGNRRTAYVAVSNSIIGAWLLLLGGLGAAVAAWSTPAAIALLGAAGLAGAWVSLRWDDPS